MDHKIMEIESYVVNFKAKYTEVLKDKLKQLHEDESCESLQNFYDLFLRDCRDYLNIKLKTPQKRILDEDVLELLKINFYLTDISFNLMKDQPNLRYHSLAFCEDVYESLSLGEIGEYFKNLQNQIPVIAKLDNDKFVFLKIANAMLKRLSTTHETELRGQIHIFLTQIFSTLHKSGTKKQINNRERTFEEENAPNNTELPYIQFKHFWILQKFLNNPEYLNKPKTELDEEEGGGEQGKVKNLQSMFKVIQRTLLYFKENPLQYYKIEVVQRFPKFLTKYSLFKNQLNDPSFRKIFLIQVYLFICILDTENYTREEKAQIQNTKQDVLKHLDQLQANLAEQVNHLTDTEKQWPIWVKEPFETAHEQHIIKKCEKAKLKKLELIKRVYDDQKFQENEHFDQILSGKKEYKLETEAIEAGMNYYLNEVIYQMDPNRRVSESERCKNMKDYAWKSVRVICKFFLKALKISNLVTNDFKPLPDLEEIVKLLNNNEEQAKPTIKPVII